MAACLLIYDIPDAADITNPSPRLLPIAVRINLSCWVINEVDIPYGLLNNLQRQGATWHVVQFAASEWSNLVAMAQSALIGDIKLAVRRTEESVTRLNATIGRGVKSNQDKIKDHRNKGNTIVKRLGKSLLAMRAAASRFGILPETIGYQSAAGSLDSYKLAILERGRQYHSATERLAEVVGTGNGIVNAARNGNTVPAGILADYMEDHGIDATGLRDIFG